MYCQRCGTPNEAGDRFCSSCGASLRPAGEPERRTSPRERLERLVGTTRRARLTTAATAAAVVVAVVAFLALEPSDDGIPRDAYTITADRLCLSAKQQIVAAERGSGDQRGPGDASVFARELVPIVTSWHSQLRELAVPVDRVEQARQLETALLEADVRIAALARVAADGNPRKTVASAKSADAASAGVEEAVAALGLSECAEATIGFTPAPG